MGLSALGTANDAVFGALKGVVFADKAVEGEAAGLGIGLLLLGAGIALVNHTELGRLRTSADADLARYGRGRGSALRRWLEPSPVRTH